MSQAVPIRTIRRVESIVDGSFIAGSPLAQSIIARDLEECSSSGHEGGDDFTDNESVTGLRRFGTNENASMLLGTGRANGVAFGSGRAALAVGAEVFEPPALLTSREIAESLQAERSLLRDNHMLPPKHRRQKNESWLRRWYRHLFSTKVRETSAEGPGLRRVPTKETNERSPLLVIPEVDVPHHAQSAYESIPPTPGDELVQARWESAVEAQLLKTTWQREAKTLAQYSSPLIVTFLLHYSVTVTSVFTVGRIGTLELGAVSLATMTANITCYAPVQGLSTCLDTLCAQAFGSGHKHLVGLQLQRLTIMLWIFLFPVALLWYNGTYVLGSIIPDQETAALAGSYLRVLILGTPGVAAFESGKRFVQAQGLFHATTWVLLVGAPLNIFANWFFVFQMGWGFTGAATAVVFTQNLLPVLLLLYVCFIEGSSCWNGLSKRAFSNWGAMIKLALPGMIMVEAQYFAFELLTLAASQFGNTQLAAQSVLVTLTSTCFNIPFPLSIAASTRVANLIGARLSGAAKTSARVALMAGILTGLFNLTLLSTLRFKLPYLFTSDEVVANIVSTVVPICAIMQIFDSLAAMSHGLLRGIGRQAIGGYTNLGSYYLIAIPISLATAFALQWKLAGLWFGVMTGLIVVSTIELLYLYQADWERAVEEAEMRLRSDHEGLQEVRSRD